jgi:hypothetical protein
MIMCVHILTNYDYAYVHMSAAYDYVCMHISSL